MSRPNVNVTVGGPQKPTNYTYKTVILKNNLPFAAQVVDPNCIYVIKWDFDLKGETVTIPENCVLKFEGGSLSNGIVSGNHTGIEAGLVDIFSTNVKLSGTWDVVEYYPEWFGAKGDGITDDSDAINLMIRNLPYIRTEDDWDAGTTEVTINETLYRDYEGVPYYSHDTAVIRFSSGKTYIAYINVFRSNITFIGYGAKIKGVPNKQGTIFLLGYPNYSGIGYDPDVDPSDTSWKYFHNINIFGFDVDGDYQHTLHDGSNDLTGHGFLLTLVQHSTFKDMYIHDCHVCCFDNASNSHFNYVEVTVENGGNTGVFVYRSHYPNFDVNSSRWCQFKVISKGGKGPGFRLDGNCRHNICDVLVHDNYLTLSVGGSQPSNQNVCSDNYIRASVFGNKTTTKYALVMMNEGHYDNIKANIIDISCEGIKEKAVQLGCQGNQITINSRDCLSTVLDIKSYCKYNNIILNSCNDGANLGPAPLPSNDGLILLQGEANRITANVRNFAGVKFVNGNGSGNIIESVSDIPLLKVLGGSNNTLKQKINGTPLLWTNPDITQEVTNNLVIDLSAYRNMEYDAVRIEFIDSITDTQGRYYGLLSLKRENAIGSVNFIDFFRSPSIVAQRWFTNTIDSENYKVTIKECRVGTSSISETELDPTRLIPYKVWGVYFD